MITLSFFSGSCTVALYSQTALPPRRGDWRGVVKIQHCNRAPNRSETFRQKLWRWLRREPYQWGAYAETFRFRSDIGSIRTTPETWAVFKFLVTNDSEWYRVIVTRGYPDTFERTFVPVPTWQKRKVIELLNALEEPNDLFQG